MSLSVTRRGGVYSSYSLFFFLYFVDSQNENGLKETATVVTAEGVGEYQWSKRDFEICGPRSMAKDAAGTPRWRKKNNVSENWTELVKSLVVVWKLPGLRVQLPVPFTLYLFEGSLPSGHKVPKSLFNGYRVVSWFRVPFSKSTSYPAPIPSEIERALHSYRNTKLIARYFRVRVTYIRLNIDYM